MHFKSWEGLLFGFSAALVSGLYFKYNLKHLFGCNRDIDIGHGAYGHIYRCSTCGLPYLVKMGTNRALQITEAQAMDYAEFFES